MLNIILLIYILSWFPASLVMTMYAVRNHDDQLDVFRSVIWPYYLARYYCKKI